MGKGQVNSERRRRVRSVVGRVSMDLTIVDISHIRGVAVGDEVVLIGRDRGKSVDAAELARLCESVPYEILCGLSQECRECSD